MAAIGNAGRALRYAGGSACGLILHHVRGNSAVRREGVEIDHG